MASTARTTEIETTSGRPRILLDDTSDTNMLYVIASNSDDAVRGVRQILHTYLGITWGSVVVDQYSKTLTALGTAADGKTWLMRVSSMNCGFYGSGTYGAADILVMLNWGDRQPLIEMLARANGPEGRSRHEFHMAELVERQ
ncbi:MAG TPA: hypothetical protein VFZ62_03245 [Candidatus Saccharimonadales bacterium]